MTARHAAIAATLLPALAAVPGTAQTTLHVSGGLNRANISTGYPDWVNRWWPGPRSASPCRSA